ncbi:MAG: hypothetical protein AAE983_06275 [Thermoplasmataceae archaeon]
MQIAKEIWKNLNLYIKRDRTPGAFEFHPSNPGILRMVKKTYYKPNIKEFTSVSNVSMIESGGGQFIPGKTFEDNSVARFCQYFLDRNEELVTKFKDTFREITHPYYSNELQDEIAVSVLVYRYTGRILSALLKDEKTRWSKKDEEFLMKLLDDDVKLRAYSGITNITPNTFDEKSRANLDLELRYENQGVKIVIRRPELNDFPKDFVAGELEGENEIPSNISKPSLPPTSLYLYSERDSSTIPIRFHHQTESFLFGRFPAFYSQLDAFEKAFHILYWERLNCLRFFSLIQSQTVPDHSFWGYSVFLGEEKIYDVFIPKKPNSGLSHRFFEWNLKTAENRKAIDSFLNLVFKKDAFQRLLEKEDAGEGIEKRLRGVYERYNEIIDSNHDYLENINDSVVALEKFYSERKDQSKEETLRGLANLVKFLFDDDRYIYKIFEVSYCLRNKYSHHEVRDGDIRECMFKIVKYEDRGVEHDHSFYLSNLQNSLVELLRYTIIVSLISNMNSEDFAEAMRTGKSLKEALPQPISKFFQGEHYEDNFLRYLIDSNSRR